MGRLLEQVPLRVAWVKLARHVWQQRRQSAVVRNIQEYRNQILKFKAFKVLAAHPGQQVKHHHRVKAYLLMRQQQVQRHCFSIWLYEHKLGLLKQAKAVKHHRLTLKHKSFQTLALLMAG